MKSVRPILTDTIAALQKGDVAAAKVAWAPYDGKWNGIEVYISFRDLATYQELETKYQADITKLLESPKPAAAEVLPMAQAMLVKYDEAIKAAQDGPAISPLFDDVADLRIARPATGGSPSAQGRRLSQSEDSFRGFHNGMA